MAAIITDFQRDLAAKKASVKAEYKRLVRDGSSRLEVVTLLARKYKCTTVSIYNYLKS